MKADCHIHMVLDGENWKLAIARHQEKPELHWIRQTLNRYQAQGVTYLRDGGDRWGVGLAARNLARDLGIRYRTPLAPLCKKGYYGGFIGLTYETIGEYTQLIVSHRTEGADFIKIMISGLMDFDRFGELSGEALQPKMIRELIHVAHEEGFAVMAHANGARTVEAAAMAGVDSVEHGAYLDQDALCAMKEGGTVWVPTLSTIANLRGKGRFCESSVQAILESAMENLESFVAIGGIAAPGTDAGAWAVPHGAQTEYDMFDQILGAKASDVMERGINRIKEKF